MTPYTIANINVLNIALGKTNFAALCLNLNSDKMLALTF